ncbi:MAG: 4a-hydroxytetrahydrobiopterin dehydratase [Candidatus Woesebacteria bacterium]
MDLPAPDKLKSHHCVPCEGGVAPLTRAEFSMYIPQIPDWKILEEKSLQKEFVFKDFVETIAFVNKVAQIAQSEGHHPDLFIHDYKKLTVTLSTHAIGGLSVNDFVLAVKIDAAI